MAQEPIDPDVDTPFDLTDEYPYADDGAAPHRLVEQRGHRPSRRRRQLRRRSDPGARGARGGAQAPRHVHRLHRRARAPPPRPGDRRQLRRRGTGRLLRSDPRRTARRRRLPSHRQRTRHPGQGPPDREDPHGHPRAHRAARRRQVRNRWLQGVGRTARRRLVGGERPVRPPHGRRAARRASLAPGVPARHPDHRTRGDGGVRPDRHDHHLLPESRHLRDHRLQLRDPGRPVPRDGVPQQGTGDRHRRPAGRTRRRRR